MSKHLGVMLDCSRNAVMKKEKVKEFASIIKKAGYNCLMLYTEDTYEIDGEPYFGYFRGRYSVAELKEIDGYCKAIGIELIPCIQTLAHLNLMFKTGEYEDVKDCFDILLCDSDKTYELIEKMFKTLSAAFSSNKVHIGMDEAHFVGLGKYLVENGYKDRFEILKSHLGKVIEIAEKYNFSPIMWSDMFFRLSNKGEYYPEEPKLSEEAINALETLPTNLSLCYWDYYHNDKEYFTKMIKAHKDTGKPVWFAGGAWKWHGFHAGNRKTLNTMVPAISACKEQGVKNILITMWGDDGNECQAFTVLPSLIYLAELYKGNNDESKIKSRFKEIVGESFDEFMQLDLFMEDFPKSDLYVNGSKAMLYSDPFYGKFDNTVVGNESAAFKVMAQNLAVCHAQKGKFGLLFESMERFARLISVKYDLGYRTRKYYSEHNTQQIRTLLKDYDLVLKYANEFLDKFEQLWYSINKPNGFEIQQIRIGGMIERVKRCKYRLEQYLSGAIKTIEELDETLIVLEDDKKRLPELNSYKDTVSTNLF